MNADAPGGRLYQKAHGKVRGHEGVAFAGVLPEPVEKIRMLPHDLGKNEPRGAFYDGDWHDPERRGYRKG
ncbi:hypothetical protein D3C72_2177360 [compost metagenome]